MKLRRMGKGREENGRERRRERARKRTKVRKRREGGPL